MRIRLRVAGDLVPQPFQALDQTFGEPVPIQAVKVILTRVRNVFPVHRSVQPVTNNAWATATIEAFYEGCFNPYLSSHRPCGVPEIRTKAKGKQRRVYRWYATP